MNSAIRLLVWTIGTLSVAVLTRHGLDVPVFPVLGQVLDAYDGFVRALLGWAEPLVDAQVPTIAPVLGLGPKLLPHWSHVFLIAALHMMPRADATYGTSGSTVVALRALQAVAAVAAAAVIALVIGTSPFLDGSAPSDVFVFLVLGCALGISFLFEWNAIDADEGGDAPQWKGRGFTIYRSLGWGAFLVGTGAGLVVHWIGLIDAAQLERAFPFLVVISAAVWLAGFIFDVYQRSGVPPVGRRFLDAPWTVASRFAIGLVCLLIIGRLDVAIGAHRTVMFAALLFGLVSLGAAGALMSFVTRLIKPEAKPALPQAPAVGVFILGAALLLGADQLISRLAA